MAETKTITLPDVGDFEDIEIIEILVNPGETIDAEQGLIVLESDKATMEIPSPDAGKIKTLAVVVGDRVNQGDAIATIEVGEEAVGAAEPEAPAAAEPPSEAKDETPAEPPPPAAPAEEKPDATLGKTRRPHPGSGDAQTDRPGKLIHASPSIRRYARELGVNLEQVIGTGTKGRVVKADVKAFVKSTMSSGAAPSTGGIAVGGMPEVLDDERGRLVDPTDVDAIADAVTSFVACADRRAAAGQNARAYTERHFDPARVAETHRELYATLAEARTPS